MRMLLILMVGRGTTPTVRLWHAGCMKSYVPVVLSIIGLTLDLHPRKVTMLHVRKD